MSVRAPPVPIAYCGRLVQAKATVVTFAFGPEPGYDTADRVSLGRRVAWSCP
jgi:hypothetical protein